MNSSIVSQLREAIRKAQRLMKAARERGDVEAFHCAQVQYNALVRQLERVKRGEYPSLEREIK